MSNSEKSAYFRHVFANNFFWMHFFKTFTTDSKSARNSAFFDTHIEFYIKKMLLLALFVNFDCKCAGNGSIKLKIFFLWMCLRILIGNHQRVCITKFLKSLYPTAHHNLRISAIPRHYCLIGPFAFLCSIPFCNLEELNTGEEILYCMVLHWIHLPSNLSYMETRSIHGFFLNK